MKTFLQLYIFSNLLIACLAHGIHFSQAVIPSFEINDGARKFGAGSMTKETIKRNVSPLDDLFEKWASSKRSYQNDKKTAHETFFQQLCNVLIAPCNQRL